MKKEQNKPAAVRKNSKKVRQNISKEYDNICNEAYKEWNPYKQLMEKVLNNKALALTQRERYALIGIFGKAIFGSFFDQNNVTRKIREAAERKCDRIIMRVANKMIYDLERKQCR